MDPEILARLREALSGAGDFAADVIDPRRGRGIWGFLGDAARDIQRRPIQSLTFDADLFRQGGQMAAERPLLGSALQGLAVAGVIPGVPEGGGQIARRLAPEVEERILPDILEGGLNNRLPTPAAPVGSRFRTPDGAVMLSRNTHPDEGPFRITYFDAEGNPSTHTDFPSLEEAERAFQESHEFQSAMAREGATGEVTPIENTAPQPRTVRLEHRGPRAGEFDYVDPAFQGTGQTGVEGARQAADPDSFLPRSYYNRAGTRVEDRFAHQPVAEVDIPEHLIANRDQWRTFLDEAIRYLGERGVYDAGRVANIAEQLAANQGFHAVEHLEGVVQSFVRQPVRAVRQPVRAVERRSGGAPRPGGNRAGDPAAEEIARVARTAAEGPQGLRERAGRLQPYYGDAPDPLTALKRLLEGF